MHSIDCRQVMLGGFGGAQDLPQDTLKAERGELAQQVVETLKSDEEPIATGINLRDAATTSPETIINGRVFRSSQVFRCAHHGPAMSLPFPHYNTRWGPPPLFLPRSPLRYGVAKREQRPRRCSLFQSCMAPEASQGQHSLDAWPDCSSVTGESLLDLFAGMPGMTCEGCPVLSEMRYCCMHKGFAVLTVPNGEYAQ